MNGPLNRKDAKDAKTAAKAQGAYVVSPGYEDTDATNYCFTDDREEVFRRVIERVEELVDDGRSVYVERVPAEEFDGICDECEAEDCALRASAVTA